MSCLVRSFVVVAVIVIVVVGSRSYLHDHERALDVVLLILFRVLHALCY